MFERFTERTRRAVVNAQPETGQLGHPFIGTEHLLFGLWDVGDVATEALASQGVTSAALRRLNSGAGVAIPACAS